MARFGVDPAGVMLRQLGVYLLVWGVPALTCALIVGLVIVFSNNEAVWPEGLLIVIVAVLWFVSAIVTSLDGDGRPAFEFIAALAANSWVSGWFAIRVVRKARRAEGTPQAGESPRITPEMERVARARFVTNAARENKEAIRAEPQELTEPPRPT
jgi:hypothetical protein